MREGHGGQIFLFHIFPKYFDDITCLNAAAQKEEDSCKHLEIFIPNASRKNNQCSSTDLLPSLTKGKRVLHFSLFHLQVGVLVSMSYPCNIKLL